MRKLKNSELNRIDVEEFKSKEKIQLTVVMDNIRSLSNVGSVFRTSDAFLVKEIVLCGITATPPHKEIQKTALGATDSVDWRYEENAIDVVKELQHKGITVWAVEQADEKIWANDFVLPPSGELALVFGNEVNYLYKTTETKYDIFKEPEIAYLFVHQNKVIGSQLIPGLEIDTEELEDGINAISSPYFVQPFRK